jgi:hypothetical protein
MPNLQRLGSPEIENPLWGPGRSDTSPLSGSSERRWLGVTPEEGNAPNTFAPETESFGSSGATHDPKARPTSENPPAITATPEARLSLGLVEGANLLACFVDIDPVGRVQVYSVFLD